MGDTTNQHLESTGDTEEGVIKIDGFPLKYRIEGKGIPTLVIGSATYYPRIFSKNMRKHFRMVFIDHRGFVSPPGPVDKGAFELDVLLNDFEHIRKELGLEKVVVIGHSGHGYMALEYAKKYPKHVSHVVLIGLGPDHSQASHDAADKYLSESVSPARKTVLEENLKKLPAEIEANPDKRFVTFCLRMGAKSWYDYNFDAADLWEGVEVNMQAIDHLWGKVFDDIDVTQGLENFNIPVLLALGRYDFLVAPPHTWEPIREKFHNLTVSVFEKSGHCPQYEEPELFDEHLLGWLSETSENLTQS